MSDRQIAAKWAYDLLQAKDWVILDTETTGLGKDDQICSVAVMDSNGKTLLDQLVQPLVPISAGAQAIHRISDEMVCHAPTFDQVLLPLMRAIGVCNVVIYNAGYDLKMIQQSIRPYGIQLAFPTSDRRQCRIFTNGGSIYCAMAQYSKFVGQWNSQFGDYKWQRLPGGDHTALGDCKATLDVIHRMAAAYTPLEPVSVEDYDY